MITKLIAVSLQGKETEGTYGYFGFGSIEEELVFIAILSVILVILLLCGYRQKRQLEKMQKDPNTR